MKRQPILFVCIFFILGIYIQENWQLTQNFSVGITLLFILLSFVLQFIKYHLKKYKWIIICFAFVGLGAYFHSLKSEKPSFPKFNQKEVLDFKLVKKMNSNDKNRKYEILAKSKNKEFSVVLSVPKEIKTLDYNHYYQAEVYLNPTEPPKQNYGFNYSQYLNRNGIYHLAYLPNNFRLKKRDDHNLWEVLQQKRLELIQKIEQTKISEENKNFLKGIILADRTEMDSETISNWSRSGLIHLLAISGTHIVIIFGIFYWVFNLIFTRAKRNWIILISLLLIWLFAVFIGMGASVVRACTMISFYFAFVLLGRKTNILHSMALAALVMLFFKPNWIFDIGFQLSFLAVLGIYWLNTPILSYFPIPQNNVQKILFSTISISFAAQTATLPIVMYYFHQFSFISYIANIVIIPFAEIIIIISFGITILIELGWDLDFLLTGYDFMITLLQKIVSWLAKWDKLILNQISLNLIEVFLLIGVVYFLRFLILKPNYRNTMPILWLVISFLITREISQLINNQTDEVLVHTYFKEKLFSVKKGKKLYFWIPEHSQKEKLKKYIIDPYSTYRRCNVQEIKTIPKDSEKIIFCGKEYNLK